MDRDGHSTSEMRGARLNCVSCLTKSSSDAPWSREWLHVAEARLGLRTLMLNVDQVANLVGGDASERHVLLVHLEILAVQNVVHECMGVLDMAMQERDVAITSSSLGFSRFRCDCESITRSDCFTTVEDVEGSAECELGDAGVVSEDGWLECMDPLIGIRVAQGHEDGLERSVESLDHPVALWMIRRREQLLDVHARVQLAHELIAKLHAVVREDATGDTELAEDFFNECTCCVRHRDLLHRDRDGPMREVVDG